MVDETDAALSLRDLLAHLPLGDMAKDDIIAAMSGPDRHYHGVDHLAILWRRHRAHATCAGLADPSIDRLVACAIAYHDRVYDARRRDNEDRSAIAWMDASFACGFSEGDRTWVADTIRATRDHLSYALDVGGDMSEADDLRQRMRIWVLDLDLTPLAEEPAVFDDNTRLLRAEASHLDDAQWDAARLGFLGRFLHAPEIYRSPVLADAYDQRARANLARQFG